VSLRLYRVSIPCRILILSHSGEAAVAYAIDDYDAQADSMKEEEVTYVKLSRVEDLTPVEGAKPPCYASDVTEKEKVMRAASGWMAIIVAEEEDERRRRDEFNRRQLQLPGVE
jgi:hypothetical protein